MSESLATVCMTRYSDRPHVLKFYGDMKKSDGVEVWRYEEFRKDE